MDQQLVLVRPTRATTNVVETKNMTIGGLAASAAPELFNAFAKSRPAAQKLWQRAEKVLGGGAGHDLRCSLALLFLHLN